MFKKLKGRIISDVINEIIDEFKNLCFEWDAKTEVKKELNEDVTFEVGVGSGLRKAIMKAYDIKQKYK